MSKWVVPTVDSQPRTGTPLKYTNGYFLGVYFGELKAMFTSTVSRSENVARCESPSYLYIKKTGAGAPVFYFATTS